MRLPSVRLFAKLSPAPLLLIVAACTAQGSSTVVQGPDGTSGGPVFPGADMGDGGAASQDPSATDYAALFGPPASTDATPNTLTGLWAGTSGYANVDTRLELSGSSIVIAVKCGSEPIGIDVVARVTSSSIKTLESKSYVAPPTSTSGGFGMGTSSGKTTTCSSLGVVPFEIPRCNSMSDSDADYEATQLANGCFFLSGTSLTFYKSGTLVGPAKLTKLSD